MKRKNDNDPDKKENIRKRYFLEKEILIYEAKNNGYENNKINNYFNMITDDIIFVHILPYLNNIELLCLRNTNSYWKNVIDRNSVNKRETQKKINIYFGKNNYSLPNAFINQRLNNSHLCPHNNLIIETNLQSKLNQCIICRPITNESKNKDKIHDDQSFLSSSFTSFCNTQTQNNVTYQLTNSCSQSFPEQVDHCDVSKLNLDNESKSNLCLHPQPFICHEVSNSTLAFIPLLERDLKQKADHSSESLKQEDRIYQFDDCSHLKNMNDREQDTTMTESKNIIFIKDNFSSFNQLRWAIKECGYKMNKHTCYKAAKNNNLFLLIWARLHGCPWDITSSEIAAKKGHFVVLKWLIEHSCPFNKDIFYHVAERGYLDILKWAKIYHYCRWDERLFCFAAKGGHLKILEWLKNERCPCDTRVCSYAAKNGHLHILKWLRENQCPWDSKTCVEAVRSNHFEVLKWAHENGCSWDEETCKIAAKYNRFEILQWAIKNKCPYDFNVCNYAAKNGNLNLLIWARNNNCPWNSSVCYIAAYNGHEHILKWARENGCAWCKKTTFFSVFNDHFEIFKWAYENGCPWDIRINILAAKKGNIHILKIAFDNQEEISKEISYQLAKKDHIELLKWAIKEKNCPWDTRVYEIFIQNDSLDNFIWAYKNNCPLNENICSLICKYGRVSFLNWIYNNDISINDTKCIHYAIKYNFVNILECIKENNRLNWDQYKKNKYHTVIKYGNIIILDWLISNGYYSDNDKNNICSFAASYNKLTLLKWARSKNYAWDETVLIEAYQKGHMDILIWALDNGCPNENISSHSLLNYNCEKNNPSIHNIYGYNISCSENIQNMGALRITWRETTTTTKPNSNYNQNLQQIINNSSINSINNYPEIYSDIIPENIIKNENINDNSEISLKEKSISQHPTINQNPTRIANIQQNVDGLTDSYSINIQQNVDDLTDSYSEDDEDDM